MVLDPTTFISDTVLFLRNYLRTNITDPLSGRSDGFVMTSYPKRDVQYPLITIKNTAIKTGKLGMSSEVHRADINIEVRVWARNSKECDNLTQQVITSLKNAEYGTNGTSEFGVYDFKLLSTNSVVESEGDNSVHSKVMSYLYLCILT